MHSEAFWLLFYYCKHPTPPPPSLLSFISSPYQFFLPLPLLLPLVLLNYIHLFKTWSKRSYQPDSLSVCTSLSYLLRCCPSVPIDKALGSPFISNRYLVTRGKAAERLSSPIALHLFIHTQTIKKVNRWLMSTSPGNQTHQKEFLFSGG